MRVPILRPRLAAWLDGAMMAAALATALLALYWQAVLSVAALLLLGALAAAGAWFMMRARPAVRAIRMDRDGAFHLRMRNGWHPAEWIAASRGPRWLTLVARLPAGSCNGPAATTGNVTFTVWQDGLPAQAWRRTCMLANRRLCRTPSRRTVGTP
ncbi:MAG TPA: hypothetical protein VL522_08720 [Bordetella sp.]|nr:hypothetical protein [Bordetella sp.]